MKLKEQLFTIIFSVLLSTAAIEGYSAQGPNIEYKKSGNKELVAEILGDKIYQKNFTLGLEQELYEAERKVFEIKLKRIKDMLFVKLMDAHPAAKGKKMTDEEFIDRVIAKDLKVGESEIDQFAAQRKIPKKHLTAQLRERISKFLAVDLKKKAVEKWLAEKTKKNPVVVYLAPPTRPVFQVAAGKSPYVGGKKAAVEVIEFSDFQCPFCARGRKVMDQLKEKYGSKIKIVFKNFPLPFHKNAKQAAVAGVCAHRQGQSKFWKLHDKMFENQSQLDQEGLKKLAGEVKLELKKFSACLSSPDAMKVVEKDIAQGEEVGVKSTPTFFVNGQLVAGVQALEVFSDIIDKELSK